jgi:hypothetical protein
MRSSGIHIKGRPQLKNAAKPHKRRGAGKSGHVGGKVNVAPKGIPNRDRKTLLQDRNFHNQKTSIIKKLLLFQGLIYTIKL